MWLDSHRYSKKSQYSASRSRRLKNKRDRLSNDEELTLATSASKFSNGGILTLIKSFDTKFSFFSFSSTLH